AAGAAAAAAAAAAGRGTETLAAGVGRGRGFAVGRGRGLRGPGPGAPGSTPELSPAAGGSGPGYSFAGNGAGGAPHTARTSSLTPPASGGGGSGGSGGSGHGLRYSIGDLKGIQHGLERALGGKLPLPQGAQLPDLSEVTTPEVRDGSAPERPGPYPPRITPGFGPSAAPHQPGWSEAMARQGSAPEAQQAAPKPQAPPPVQQVMSVEAYLADAWLYKDPQGEVQGPFSRADILEWHSSGFFTQDLPVKSQTDPATSPFHPLGTFLKLWAAIAEGRAPPQFRALQLSAGQPDPSKAADPATAAAAAAAAPTASAPGPAAAATTNQLPTTPAAAAAADPTAAAPSPAPAAAAAPPQPLAATSLAPMALQSSAPRLQALLEAGLMGLQPTLQQQALGQALQGGGQGLGQGAHGPLLQVLGQQLQGLGLGGGGAGGGVWQGGQGPDPSGWLDGGGAASRPALG
ncbi:hypothetical protein QJQ45_016933, partial [Haematococcus lacustris]